MKIELEKSVEKIDYRFIGEVAYLDERKFDIYQKIFRKAKTGPELKDQLKKDGIEEAAINEFCRTLKKLKLLNENGDLETKPLIAEYGDYIITLLVQNEDPDPPYHPVPPYQYLPLHLKRALQEQEQNSDSIEEVGNHLQREIKKTEDFISTNPIGKIYKIDASANLTTRDATIYIQIDTNANKWDLCIDENSFIIPFDKRFPIAKIFNYELVESGNNVQLRLPFSQIKKYPNVLDNFIINFSEQQFETPWGKFNISYNNVPILPLVSEVSAWYKEIFRKSLNINGYKTQEDLQFIWNDIFRDNTAFQRKEYEGKISRFNYDELIEATRTQTEEYWMLYAAKDLDPNKIETKENAETINTSGIHIAANDKANLKIDFIDKWPELKSATNIYIYDNYCGTFHSLRTLQEIFKQINTLPQKVILVSKEQDASGKDPSKEKKERDFLEMFKKQYNVKLIFQRAEHFEHDRYWNIDGKCFTVGTSINNIWIVKVKGENYDSKIKSQININEINIHDIPQEIQNIWSQHV